MPLVLERGVTLPGYGRYLAVEDTVLDSAEGDVPQGGAAALLANANKTVLIQFLDLERAVGRNKRVIKASLELTLTAGDPKLVSARRVLQPWTEGPLNTIAGQLRGDDFGARWAATFRNRRNGIDPIPWQRPGAKGEQDSEPIPTATGKVTENRFRIDGLEAAVNAQLARWYDNHGFLIEIDSKADFLSSSAGEGRPRLILEVEDVPAPQAGPDLSITLISRTPEYERYDTRVAPLMAEQDGVPIPVFERIPNASSKKWPDEGESLTYRATVKNVGSQTAEGFEAQWLVREASQSIVGVDRRLAPGESTTLEIQVPYRSTHGDHRVQPIALRIFPKGADRDRSNDFLEVQQSALALGVTIDPAVVAQLERAPEDWVNDEVRRWNEVVSRYSRYSFAPNGSLERVRIQSLAISASEAPENLMLDGQIHVSTPGTLTAAIARACGLVPLTTDGLRAGSITADGLRVRPSIDRFAGISGGGDIRADTILVPSLPFPYDVFYDPVADPSRLDAGEVLSATDVFMLNANLGRRRGLVGDALYAVPGSVLVTLTDMAGQRLANANVTLYQMKNGSFDGTAPVAQFQVGEQGTLGLPKRETQTTPGFYFPTGHTPVANPFGRIDPCFGNGALLVKVTVNGVTETAVLKLWQVLDAAARIRRPVAIMALRFNVPCAPLVGGNLAQGRPCSVPALIDGNPENGSEISGPVDLDLGQDVPIGEIEVVGSGTGAYDVMVWGANEKPESARLYAREGDFRWSSLCRGDGGSLFYRYLPQRARYVRFVPSAGSKLTFAEIRVRAAQR